jgi:1-acyl-sn-glycerol-3-phosphate acyltransferase
MLRYSAGLIFLIFYVIWGALLYPFYILSGKKTGKYLVRNLFIVVLKICGVKIVAEGLENVNENEIYLVVGNHQSVFDIPVIGAVLPLNLRIFAKKELSRIPVFGQLMVLYDFVFVNRNNQREAVRDLKKAAQKMEHCSFLVFPEGTRSKDGRVGKFKSGAFSLAFESGKTILPVALTGVANIMRPGKLTVNKGTVYMKIFPPVKIEEGDSRKSVAEKLQLIISEHVHSKGGLNEKDQC